MKKILLWIAAARIAVQKGCLFGGEDEPQYMQQTLERKRLSAKQRETQEAEKSSLFSEAWIFKPLEELSLLICG